MLYVRIIFTVNKGVSIEIYLLVFSALKSVDFFIRTHEYT